MDLTSSGKLKHLSASVQEKCKTKGFVPQSQKNKKKKEKEKRRKKKEKKTSQTGFLGPPLLFVLTILQLAAL